MTFCSLNIMTLQIYSRQLRSNHCLRETYRTMLLTWNWVNNLHLKSYTWCPQLNLMCWRHILTTLWRQASFTNQYCLQLHSLCSCWNQTAVCDWLLTIDVWITLSLRTVIHCHLYQTCWTVFKALKGSQSWTARMHIIKYESEVKMSEKQPSKHSSDCLNILSCPLIL